ncbi:MAG: hypothetical protein ABII02_02110 [Candidatus Magasanikbacteria bacterium]
MITSSKTILKMFLISGCFVVTVVCISNILFIEAFADSTSNYLVIFLLSFFLCLAVILFYLFKRYWNSLWKLLLIVILYAVVSILVFIVCINVIDDNKVSLGSDNDTLENHFYVSENQFEDAVKKWENDKEKNIK